MSTFNEFNNKQMKANNWRRVSLNARKLAGIPIC